MAEIIMANKRKKPKDCKSEHLSIRVTPEQKEHWEQLAKIRGLTLSQLISQMVNDFLENPNWKKQGTWKCIKAAITIIDDNEHNGGRKDNDGIS